MIDFNDKFEFVFAQELDYLKSAIVTKNVEGKEKTSIYGRNDFSKNEEDSFRVRVDAQGNRVTVIKDDELKGVVSKFNLIDGKSRIESASINEPYSSFWEHKNLFRKIRHDGTTRLDGKNPIDRFWLMAFYADKDRFHFDVPGSEEPSSYTGLKFVVRPLRSSGKKISLSGIDEKTFDFTLKVHSLDFDDKVEVIKSFEDYSGEDLSDLDDSALTKIIIKLSEDSDFKNKFGETAFVAVDRTLSNVSSDNEDIAEIVEAAIENKIIAVEGGVFKFDSFELGKTKAAVITKLKNKKSIVVLEKIKKQIAIID